MLIFLRHELAFLATPKTGTTAIEAALRPKAEIIFAKDRKHITALRFNRKIAPFIEQTFGARVAGVAVMREPVEQIRSWYRYRSSNRLNGHKLSTRGMSFDAFVEAVISDDPPPFARIGSQFRFLTSDHGDVLVEHLFAYNHQPVLRRFFEERFEQSLVLKSKNVSPRMDAPLSAATETLLRDHRAAEFALFDRIVSAGGFLNTPQSGPVP